MPGESPIAGTELPVVCPWSIERVQWRQRLG